MPSMPEVVLSNVRRTHLMHFARGTVQADGVVNDCILPSVKVVFHELGLYLTTSSRFTSRGNTQAALTLVIVH